jgi:hypothetical protein
MSQLADRLQAAVYQLVGDGSVKTRLAQAYSGFLSDLDEDSLSEESRARFVSLRESLHQHRPFGTVTAVQASVRKMSASEADAHAVGIVQLLLQVLREQGSGERFKVVAGGQGANTGADNGVHALNGVQKGAAKAAKVNRPAVDARMQPPAFLAEGG